MSQGFTPGLYQPKSLSGSSYATYTPMYKDNSSRGRFSNVLLQPSQTGSIRRLSSSASSSSSSFLQRRKLQRQSEGGNNAIIALSQNGRVPNNTNQSLSSSSYSSASVAKRILDTLSELQTPMEEARQKPISITAALTASKDALARTERLPLSNMIKEIPNNEKKSENNSKLNSFLNFPTVKSLGPAAVAASTSLSTYNTLPTSTTTPSSSSISYPSTGQLSMKENSVQSMKSSSFSFPLNSNITSTPTASRETEFIDDKSYSFRAATNQILKKSPLQSSLPYQSTSTSTSNAPKTPNSVKFVDMDSEFTFGEPHQVDGVDSSEMERILSPAGSMRKDDRIKFAFSPPGKSATKKRNSFGTKEEAFVPNNGNTVSDTMQV